MIKRDVPRPESYKIRAIDYDDKGLFIELEREDHESFNLHINSRNYCNNLQEVEYFKRAFDHDTKEFKNILEGKGELLGIFQYGYFAPDDGESYPVAVIKLSSGEVIKREVTLIRYIKDEENNDERIK